MTSLADAIGGYWCQVRDGNRAASTLYKRHYSCKQYKDGRRNNIYYRNRHLIIGPGEKMVLITADGRALFGWRKFKDDSGQQGVNCAVFRNEGDTRSSDLIQEAAELAWTKWPGERLYTYVNPAAIRTGSPATGKPFPGKCFVKAGWTLCPDLTGSGLLIFEKLPPKNRSDGREHNV